MVLLQKHPALVREAPACGALEQRCSSSYLDMKLSSARVISPWLEAETARIYFADATVLCLRCLSDRVRTV